MDDVYDISFPVEVSDLGSWRRAPSEPSAAFWSAVTNPSVNVQLAWSPRDQSLLQAPTGVTLTDELLPIEKLTSSDYQNIAMEFVNSIDSLNPEDRAKALETAQSLTKFTKMMRERGILAKWEEFRINRACKRFAEKFSAKGAGPQVTERWTEILKQSQRKARALRTGRSILPTRGLELLVNREPQTGDIPQPRAVAIKAMEFLSDSELYNLSLPLGTVMLSIKSLLDRS